MPKRRGKQTKKKNSNEGQNNPKNRFDELRFHRSFLNINTITNREVSFRYPSVVSKIRVITGYVHYLFWCCYPIQESCRFSHSNHSYLDRRGCTIDVYEMFSFLDLTRFMSKKKYKHNIYIYRYTYIHFRFTYLYNFQPESWVVPGK